MTSLPHILSTVFEEIENRTEPIHEFEVASQIEKVAKCQEANGKDIPMELQAEFMAFRFCTRDADEDSHWNTFFAPVLAIPQGDGMYELPSVSSVTSEMLTYWEVRSNEATHPILKARYADLVWDLTRKVTQEPANGVNTAFTAIDSYLTAVENQNCPDQIDGRNRVSRALSLALSVKDKNRTERAVNTIIEYEKAIAEAGKLGTWGFSYDLLIENQRVELSQNQSDTIISRLEEQLAEAVQIPDGADSSRNHFAARQAAMRLASYYRRSGMRDDVQRVLAQYAAAVQSWAGKAWPIIVVAWLTEVYETFIDFELSDEADKISVMMRDLGENSHKNMTTITHKVKISNDEITSYVDEMLRGDDDEIAARIAQHFIPNPHEVEKQVRVLAKQSPLSSMITHSIQDSDGREIASIGSVEDDLDGRVVLMMNQNMQIEGMSLDLVMKGWINRSKLTDDAFLDRLMVSPLFTDDRRETLTRGLAAYFAKDHLSAVHLLVPQIENAFRRLLIATGRSIYKPSNAKKGVRRGISLKLLHALLNDTVCEQVFGPNAVKYFKVLLTDSRGWNLRNVLCHGFEPLPVDSPALSNRVMHVLLILSFAREQEESTSSEEG